MTILQMRYVLFRYSIKGLTFIQHISSKKKVRKLIHPSDRVTESSLTTKLTTIYEKNETARRYLNGNIERGELMTSLARIDSALLAHVSWTPRVNLRRNIDNHRIMLRRRKDVMGRRKALLQGCSLCQCTPHSLMVT